MNFNPLSNSQPDHIVFLGESTFPVGLAAVQRMLLMAKALHHEGCSITVICRKGGLRNNIHNDIPAKGTYEGINYVYTSGTIYRPEGFLRRNILKIKGMIGEFRYLARLKKQKSLTAAIISNHYIHHLLLYRFYSLILGFPVVLNFVEMASAMKGREKFIVRMNDIIFDKYLVKIVDGAMPISEKLLEYYHLMSPKKTSLKLPIICDFTKFTYSPRIENEIAFLYCGAASYYELVDFVIISFEQLHTSGKEVYLDLLLGGREDELKKISERIALAKKKEFIRFQANVPHDKIPEQYSKASALLIPLRPTVQDESRFPHKIGEYLASGRPMITTAFGEINHYDFTDKETALVAEEYNANSFAEKMQYVITHPEESIEIGIKGRQMGLRSFDYTRHGSRMLEYLKTL